MTQHIRTNNEQLTALPIDNVSGVVYSTDELMESQRSRQVYLSEYSHIATPHSHPTVSKLLLNVVLGAIIPLCVSYAKVNQGTQTRLRKEFNVRSLHTRLRKGILNSFIMRKSTRLKEPTYGQKLYDRQ